MNECVMCTRNGIVYVSGKAELSGNTNGVSTVLCVDHYNMVKSEGKKWCPNCTTTNPVEMEYDGLVGDTEHWYCHRCDTEYEYPRTDK